VPRLTTIAAIAGLALLHAMPALPAADGPVASRAGSLKSAVSHPTRTVVTAPSSVQAGGAIWIAVRIQSSTRHPAGTCFVQQQLAWRWSTVARANTTTGACSVRLVLGRPGTALLRVHFSGSSGWGSSTSRSITVRVF
jgi:hypothetical protein